MNAHAHPLVIEPDTPEGFTFEQLSDKAKDRARQAYLESDPYDYDWWEFTCEDADRIASLMGIDIKRETLKNARGSRFSRLSIYFSGFSCQGDGACLEGDWSPLEHPGAMVRKVRAYAPRDKDLHKIALALGKLSRDAKHFEYVRTTITHRGNYYHSRSVDIETEIEMPHEYEHWCDFKQAAFHAVTKGFFDRVDEEVKDALRAFMDWIYQRLSDEWYAMHEDDYVDEHLSNQDTLFDEDGDEI